LIQGLRSGEQEAIVTFWNRYGPMLERLADRNLAQGMRRRFGPEDIVQSACRTFFRRAQAGEFEIPSEDSLLPFDVPNPPAWPDSDLGVPTRPDRTYGLNQGYGNNNLKWGGELPVTPPAEIFIPGVPFTSQPQYEAAPPQEKPVDWGALFGGVADSLKGTSTSSQPRSSNYTTLFSH